MKDTIYNYIATSALAGVVLLITSVIKLWYRTQSLECQMTENTRKDEKNKDDLHRRIDQVVSSHTQVMEKIGELSGQMKSVIQILTNKK